MFFDDRIMKIWTHSIFSQCVKLCLHGNPHWSLQWGWAPRNAWTCTEVTAPRVHWTGSPEYHVQPKRLVKLENENNYEYILRSYTCLLSRAFRESRRLRDFSNARFRAVGLRVVFPSLLRKLPTHTSVYGSFRMMGGNTTRRPTQHVKTPLEVENLSEPKSDTQEFERHPTSLESLEWF